MRKSTCVFAFFIILLGAAGIVRAETAQGTDRVYADRYGNLVIVSAAGSKRILVGRADLAPDITEPDVIYLDEGDAFTSQHRHPKAQYRCSGGAAIYRGRSYMYGLTRDEVPVLTNDCH